MPRDDAGWYQRRIASLLTEPRESQPDRQDDGFGLRAESPDVSRFLTNLQSKRLRMVAHAYPATVRAASEEYGWTRLAEMFWADQPPRHMRPDTAYIQNIDMWSTFIQERAFAARLPWITDLARFERFRCKLILRAEEMPENAEQSGSGKILLGERYHISPLCDVRSFRYDVIAIAAHFLRAGALAPFPPDLGKPTDIHLVIQCPPPPGDPSPRTYRVGASIARLIQVFANGKTIKEALEESPASSQQGNRERDIRAISQMAAKRVICPVPVCS
jgi:hypothetical protein